MIHAFRLGPIAPTSPPSWAYAAVIPGHALEVRQASGDPQGLAALREAVKGQPFACEPALAEAAARLGLEVAPLPPEALAERALLAWELASGLDHGASRPEVIAAFLQAAAAYWASRAWELIAPDEQLHVAFAVGRAVVQGELSIQASDPAQPRLVLCDEPGPLGALVGLAGEARVEALVRGAGLVVELARQPEWAGAAIEEVHRLPRVPMPERRRGGRVAAVATQDLVLAAALLKGVQAYADQGDGSEAEVEVAAANLRVRARIGPTPAGTRALAAWEEGVQLTPVTPGEEAEAPAPQARSVAAATPPAATEAKASPEAPRPRQPSPEKDADELSPEELAAIVAGGDEALSAPAPRPEPAEPEVTFDAEASQEASRPRSPPPEKDADELSPEELAAIMKSGDEPAAGAAPAVAGAPAAATPEEERPLSPAELAALMKGAAPEPPPAVPPPAPAPAPAPAAPTAEAPPAASPATPPAAARPEPKLTPVAPAPAAPPASPAKGAAPAPAGAEGAGWLQKVWRAFGGGERPAPAPPPARKAATPAKAPARPAAKPAVRPPPRAEPHRAEPHRAEGPDPDGPFGPFARALQIAVPPEPPAVPLAEAEQARALAGRLTADAAGQERFISFPAVALQIIELVHAPSADARGVAGFISRDPGLAADVLAVANSAAFRGVSEVTSVRDAVARLGLQEVGRVASAVSARALLVPSRTGGGQTSTRLFTRAVAVATAASATALGVRGAHSDQVWLAGLLHDVGLALGGSALHRLESAGGAGLPAAALDLALEEAHVGIGASALKAWGLPGYIADVCARHHEPEVPPEAELVDLHLVRLTSALSRLAEPAVAARAAREIVQSAQALRLDAHAVRALAADLRAAEQRAALLVR